MADTTLLDEIEDRLGAAMMDIDILISRGVPLNPKLIQIAHDIVVIRGEGQ